MAVRNDDILHGDERDMSDKAKKLDMREDDGSERKRCTLLFGGLLRRMSEHMDVLKGTMSKLSRDLQKYEEDQEWYRWGLMHGGRAVIEHKAAVLRADAVERAVHYDSDTTGYYDSEPEVVDVEVEYEEQMMEEDVAERAQSRRGRAAPPLHAQGRVGENVYEVYQVQPRSTMQRDVLVKNDPGAQITFVAPDLFAFGLKEGFIKNQRGFETEEMLGIGGSTFINTIADMEVCIEGSLIPVTIQVVPNKAIEDKNFQILLGTDNTQYMGATINLGEGHTTYTKLKGVNRTLTSMHLAAETATRVFNSSRVCEADSVHWERKSREVDSVERPEYLSPRCCSTQRMDKELGSIPAKVGMKARFMEDDEAMSIVDGMAKKDAQLLQLLDDSLEKCMKSGDRRQHKAACDMLGISGDNGSNK